MKLALLAAILLGLASPVFAQGSIDANTYKDDKLLSDTQSSDDDDKCDKEKSDDCDASSGDSKIVGSQLDDFPIGPQAPINCCGTEELSK